MRLFIIGNGFDVSHCLPTKYADFRKYLISKYGYSNILERPKIVCNSTDISVDAKILIYLIDSVDIEGTEWNDFERYLGEIEYNELLNDDIDKDDEDGFKLINENDELASSYMKSFRNIPVLFTNWINSINLNKIKDRPYTSLLTNKDLYLTFNYTKTLEDIYNIQSENICHIHGIQGSKLIVGHGIETLGDEYNDFRRYGVASSIFEDMNACLYKNTNTCLEENKFFFERCSNVDEIFIFGWSANDIDIPYLRKIRKIIDKREVEFHFTNYDRRFNKVKTMLERLLELGFNYKLGYYF